MEKARVPFVIESKQDILADVDILKIVLLIKAVNGLGDNALLGEMLFVDFWVLIVWIFISLYLLVKKTKLVYLTVLARKRF